MKKALFFIALLLIWIPQSCGHYSLNVLRTAPEHIEIDNREYVLETYLWRDFMPISPPDGKPLIAIAWITAVDSQPFPSSLDADLLWVINEDEIWKEKCSIKRELGARRQHQLEIIAREGPKWGPGIYVDVVVRIIDEENNIYLLRAEDQLIGRTD